MRDKFVKFVQEMPNLNNDEILKNFNDLQVET